MVIGRIESEDLLFLVSCWGRAVCSFVKCVGLFCSLWKGHVLRNGYFSSTMHSTMVAYGCKCYALEFMFQVSLSKQC